MKNDQLSTLALMMEQADEVYTNTMGAPKKKTRKNQYISDEDFVALDALDRFDSDYSQAKPKASTKRSTQSTSGTTVNNVTNIQVANNSVLNTDSDNGSPKYIPEPAKVEDNLHQFYKMLDGGLDTIGNHVKHNEENTQRLVDSIVDWQEWEKTRAFLLDNKEHKQAAGVTSIGDAANDSNSSNDNNSSNDSGGGFGGDTKEGKGKEGKGKEGKGKEGKGKDGKGKEGKTKGKSPWLDKFKGKKGVAAVLGAAAAVGAMLWVNSEKEDATERLADIGDGPDPLSTTKEASPTEQAKPHSVVPDVTRDPKETKSPEKPAVSDNAWNLGMGAGWMLAGAKRAPYLGSLLTVADTGRTMNKIENDDTLTTQEKDHSMIVEGGRSVGTLAGMAAGAASGAASGAAIGSIIPGAGTAVGAIGGLAVGAIGALLGSFLGDKLGASIGAYTADKIAGETDAALTDAERERKTEELSASPQRSSIFSFFSGSDTRTAYNPSQPTASPYSPTQYRPQPTPSGVDRGPTKPSTPVKFDTGDATEKRIAQYDNHINASAKKYGLDPDQIRSVIRAESAGKNDAQSPGVGAQGLMQLMPGTAHELGVKDSFDPKQNIEGGTKYLAQNIKRYEKQGYSKDDSFKLALASYNAGPGWVQGAIRKSGSKNATDVLNTLKDPSLTIKSRGKYITRSQSNIEQSDNYVKKISGNYAHRVKEREAKEAPDPEPIDTASTQVPPTPTPTPAPIVPAVVREEKDYSVPVVDGRRQFTKGNTLEARARRWREKAELTTDPRHARAMRGMAARLEDQDAKQKEKIAGVAQPKTSEVAAAPTRDIAVPDVDASPTDPTPTPATASVDRASTQDVNSAPAMSSADRDKLMKKVAVLRESAKTSPTERLKVYFNKIADKLERRARGESPIPADQNIQLASSSSDSAQDLTKPEAESKISSVDVDATRSSVVPEVSQKSTVVAQRDPIVKYEPDPVTASTSTSSSKAPESSTKSPTNKKRGVQVSTGSKASTVTASAPPPVGLSEIPVLLDEMGTGLINVGYI